MQTTFHVDSLTIESSELVTMVGDRDGTWRTFVGVEVVFDETSGRWFYDGSVDEREVEQEVPPWIIKNLEKNCPVAWRQRKFVMDAMSFRAISAPSRDEAPILTAMAATIKMQEDEIKRLKHRLGSLDMPDQPPTSTDLGILTLGSNGRA